MKGMTAMLLKLKIIRNPISNTKVKRLQINNLRRQIDCQLNLINLKIIYSQLMKINLFLVQSKSRKLHLKLIFLSIRNNTRNKNYSRK